MAKELLLNALVNVLGDYVQGITKDNLKVGVWSGKIELKNLQLNHQGIEKLKLPVSVINGYINTLTVSIPWASLASQPVKIFIDGVYLLLGPLNFNNFNSQEAYERSLAQNKAKLIQAEKSVEIAATLTAQNDPKAATYFQSLTTKIIDNIEIKISNIHFRYEDSQTFPGEVFSFGATLESFIVTTTNSRWEETFVAREGDKEQTIYKKAKMENFVAYWNLCSQQLSSLNFDSWMQDMQSLIYRKNNPIDSLQYLLTPNNSLEIKLTHYDKEGHVPRLQAEIESTKIGLSMTKTQYHQIMRSLDVYNTVSVKQQLLKFRPSERPVNHETCRQWWRYALVLLTNNETILQRKIDVTRACCRYRSKYIALIKKKNMLSLVSSSETLSDAESEEIAFIEKHLPVDTLILFRQLATKDAIVTARQLKKEEEKKAADAKKSGSWFGLWGKPKEAAEHADLEGDVSLAQLQSDLENAISTSLTDPAAFTIDLQFNSSTELTIWNDANKVITFEMAVVADAKIRPDRMSASVALTNLQISDDFTPNPLIGHLVKVISDYGQESAVPLSIEFENLNGAITISLRASRLQLCVNKYCVQQLLSILEIPLSASSSEILALQETQRAFQAKASVKRISIDKPNRRPSTAFALSALGASDLIRGSEENLTEVKSTLHIRFDAYAPQIIIPENSVEEKGYLLLDAGHLTVNGDMGPAGMSWDVRFHAINVAMPLHIGDINCVKPSYLIRPFDIELIAQDIDKSKADMTVNMMLTAIQGELDPSKLSRLLYLTEVMSSIFEAPSISLPTDNILEIPDSRTTNPLRPKMNLVVFLPSISLDVQYDQEDPLQKNVLCINYLKVNIATRAYDMQASLELRSLSVQDNMRFESQKQLAYTPVGDHQCLVLIDVKKISNRRSPLYQESDPFGNIVEIKFGSLILNTDARNLLHLRPLYEVLMGKRLTDYPPELSYDVLYKKAGSPSFASEIVPLNSGIPGTHLKLSLETISLELLRTELLTSHVARDLNAKELESVVVLDVLDMTAEVRIKSLTEATCRMKSLRIRDTRNYSEEYCFKTIFGPAAPITSLQKADSPPTLDRNISDDNAFQFEPDIFCVTFQQVSPNDSQVDIKIGNIDSFVSLDTIVDLANTAAAQALAVVELTAPVDAMSTPTPHAQIQNNDRQESSLSVNVKMMNSRLILLDDPTTLSSRAVSIRCNIDVRYRRQETFDRVSTVDEDLCLMVNDIEGYVSLDMSLDQPHQIMDPSGLTLNLKRSFDNLIPTKASLSFYIEGLSTTLSLNDILLTLSILQRRTIVDTAPPSVEGLVGDDPALTHHNAITESPNRKHSVDENMGTKAPELQHLTAYSLLVNIGTMSTVILNTYDGQHTPLLRVELSGSSFSAEGFIQDLHGHGSMLLMADSYNMNVSEWEPVVDRWAPNLTLTGEVSNLKLVVESMNTLQFSLTSTLLNTISHTYSLLQMVEDDSPRVLKPNLIIRNKLGLAAEILGTFSGDSLFQLNDGDIVDVYLSNRTHGPPIRSNPGRMTEIVSHIPSKFDLRIPLHGELGEKIIKGIPTNVNKILCYHLKSPNDPSSPKTPSQVVVETIFEYQRYQPFGGSWKEPFMMGDPPRWCNTRGRKCTLNEVTLPDSAWEWLDDWKVYVDSKALGKKMDSEGWDYAVNFSAFSSDPHGSAQPVDYARRRRWIRSRTLTSDQRVTAVSSSELFCEFKQLDDGSRELVLKSGIEVVNDLAYEILLWVQKDSTNGYEFGPIGPDEKFSLPLVCSSARNLKVRHAGIPCQWSDELSITSPTDNTHGELWCVELTGNQNIYMKTSLKRTQKLLSIIFAPNIIVTNLVPCKIAYRFAIGGDNKGKHLQIVEEGSIDAGLQTKLNHLKRSHNIFVSLQIGNFEWSEYSLPIFHPKKNSQRINVLFRKSNSQVYFILRLRVIRQKNGSTEVIVFSKDALIDYTGLGLSVEALIEKGESNRVIRSGGGGYDLTNQSKQLTKPLHALRIEHFKVKSRRYYTLSTADIRSYVHTDRKYIFSYLPPFLCGQTYIATPCDDRDLRIDGGQLLQFAMPASGYVVLLFDVRVSHLPPWVEKFGFRKTIEHVVSTGFHDGLFQEIHLAVYGKLYQEREKVALGSNHSRDSKGMYSIFVLPNDPMLEPIIGNQISFQWNQFSSSTETCWWNGGCGMTLFNSENGRVSVGLEDGRGWSEKEISLKILSTDRGTFDISDRHSGESYPLAYTVKPLPGKFKRTKVLSIIPRFVIVNTMDDIILVKQHGSNNSEPMQVEPFTSKGWYKSDRTKSSEIRFRYGASEWSLGSIDISEVGTHSVFLPVVHKDTNDRVDDVVVNIEVKLSHPNDHAAVSVIFWRSYTGDSSSPTPLSIRNDSEIPVLVKQADVSNRLYEVHVPPKGWVPFGWASLDATSAQRKVALTTCEAFGDQSCTVLVSFLGERGITKTLPVEGSRANSLCVNTEAHMNGIVLCIRNPKSSLQLQTNSDDTIDTTSLNFHFSFVLTSLGLSIVADSPQRRELVSLYAEDFDATYISHPNSDEQTYQLTIMDIQVDNYCESAIYPVLLRRVDSRRKSPQATQTPEDRPTKLPFIEFTMVEKTLPGVASCTIYEYISFRVLEFALEIDSGTIETLIRDFWCDLRLLPPDEVLASSHPSEWIRKFNGNLLSPCHRRVLVDSHRASVEARVSRMYFRELVIHPMKMALTFMQTEYQGEKDEEKSLLSPIIDIATSMATVELMEIKLNSFIVTEVVESFSTLQSRIQAKFIQDLITQLAMIAGSLTAIGSPAGLVRNIGNGVQDFFYEPYLGLVQSPEEFLLGLKRGTGSLLAGVVGGTLNSAAAIVGTASSGLAYLSGDAEYVRQRAIKRQKSDSNRDRGLVGGLKAGGKEVVSGFKSGVTGIFTKPMEEAQKDGALGFFKGLGMGVAGVAVKPVLGLADGLTTIAHGISNEVGEGTSYQYVRPPRTFSRSSSDQSVLVLAPVYLPDCIAQEFVTKYSTKKKTQEEYLASAEINEVSQVILSTSNVFWHQGKGNIWKKSWNEISHVTLEDNSIAIYLYEDPSMNRPVIIPCFTQKISEKVYQIFYECSHLMGNPEVMLSIDELQGKNVGKASSEYVFGSAHLEKVLKYKQMSTDEIISTMKHAIQNLSEVHSSIPQSFVDIDQIMGSFLFQWNANHPQRKSCCVIILNEGEYPIQISKVNLKKGKQIYLFGTRLYDCHSQTLQPRACLVIFATAHSQTLNNSGNVTIEITSPAFSALVCTRLEKSSCKSETSSGYNCFFREKSTSQQTAKYVISLS